MAKKITADSTIKFFISVIGLFVIGIILMELNHIFLSLVVAYFLFFLFSPLNNLLEKDKVPMFVIVLIDLVILIVITFGVSQFIIDSFIRLGENAPEYEEKLNTLVRNTANSVGITSPFFTNFSIKEIIKDIDYKILAGGVFTSTFNVMGNLLFLLFFFIFVVTGHQNIYEAVRKRFVNKRVKPELKKIRRQHQEKEISQEKQVTEVYENEKLEKELQLSDTFNKITIQIQRYIIAKISVNLAAGVVVGLVAYLFGLDFPIILGLFTFLFNFIPTIGSAIALVLPVLLSLIQFDSIGTTILLAIIVGIIQTVFFNVLEPMVMGKRLNLNPLLILVAVLIWGYIWGIIGMLLAVPLTAIIKIIISNSESKNLKFLNDLMSEN